MSTSGADLLMRVHGISSDRIDPIPHGIPHVPVDAASKDRLGVEGKTVILTFGLLSRDSGIEHVIDALPAILAVHPDTVHRPGCDAPARHRARGRGVSADARSARSAARRRREHDLPQPIRQPGRADRVPLATDVYITPYLQPEQITSGTLVRRGRRQGGDLDAIHLRARAPRRRTRRARAMEDAPAIAREVIALVSDRERRRAMCGRAAAYGAGMTWPAIGRRYIESFARARTEHRRRRYSTFQAQTLAARTSGLPEITLKHADMTDDTRHAPARHLQHPAARRWLLPGRQRARPAAHEPARRGRRR